MNSEARVNFVALASVPFVMVLSNSMIIPVLPAIQAALHRSLLQVGLLITVFSVAAGLVIPVGGYLSDRYGRKLVIIPSLIIFGLGGLLCGVAPVFFSGAIYTVVMIGRVVQGIGAGGTYQVAMALAGDIFRSKQRSKVLGMLEASNGLGKVVSPIMGAAAMMLIWWAPFYIYPIISAVSAVLVWRLIDEPKGTTTDRPLGSFVRGIGKVFATRGASLAACFLAGALALFFLFGILSYYSDVLEQQQHVQGVLRGLVIAIPVAVMALTSYLSGIFLVKRLQKLAKLTVVVGLACVAGAFVVMFFVHRSVVPFTAAIALMGFGNGALLPPLNTMITSATASRERGTVTALYGTVRFMGAAFGPPAFDRAVDVGPWLTYLGAAVVALGALAVAWIWIRQDQLLRTMGTPQGNQNAAGPRRSTLRLEPGPEREGGLR